MNIKIGSKKRTYDDMIKSSAPSTTADPPVEQENLKRKHLNEEE
jgi:hypothetical protein